MTDIPTQPDLPAKGPIVDRADNYEKIPIPPDLPAKDPIVDRAYDYAKWHIALYGTVLGLLAGGLALKKKLPDFLFVSVCFLVIAGIAAGTIASELSRRQYWYGFLGKKTFPLVPDSKEWGLTMQTWMHVQHAGVWAAVLWGVGYACFKATVKKNASAPVPSITAPAMPTP